MTCDNSHRGGAPVGFLTELGSVEAGAVLYLRLWSDGPESQSQVWNDFATALGPKDGREALKSFESLCSLCVRYGRRPLMRHNVACKCLGADESCFANFIGYAADGEREDALLIASSIVRPDVALTLVKSSAGIRSCAETHGHQGRNEPLNDTTQRDYPLIKEKQMNSFTLTTNMLALTLGFGTAAMADGYASKDAVLDTYADIAEAKFGDSLVVAQRLQVAVNALITSPLARPTLQAAKDAWLASRVPYQQTEVYRFGNNAIVDDWEAEPPPFEVVSPYS